MAKLVEYFDNDFKDLSIDNSINVNYQTTVKETGDLIHLSLTVRQRVKHDMNSSARLFTYYIPETTETLFICQRLIEDLEKWKKNQMKLIQLADTQEIWRSGNIQ